MTGLDAATRVMIRRLARDIARHDKQIKAISRAPQLPNSSVDGGGIDMYDADGNYLTSLGLRPDGTYGVGYNIVETDIQDDAISTPKLQANSVTADQVEAISVAAKLGQFIKVKAEQILTGTLTAAVSIVSGGSISTSSDTSGGQFEVNGDHLKYQSVGTQNLCTTPKLATVPDDAVATGCTLGVGGAPIWDGYNIDHVGVMNSPSALKLVATTADPTVRLTVGTLQPSTTYTVSIYLAAGKADDSYDFSTVINAKLAAFAIGTQADPAAFATTPNGICYDGDNPYQSTWEQFRQAHPADIDLIAVGGWAARPYWTFTTPADLAADTPCVLTIPGPTNTDGTTDTVRALFLAGAQTEAKPYVTPYCDGDQPGCVWDGAADASTSTRNQFVGLFMPSWSTPRFVGSLNAPKATLRQLKRGSGAPQGTNQVQVYQPSPWTLADKTNYTPTFSVEGPRKSQDDGIIWDGASEFNATVQGVWYYAFMFHLAQLPNGSAYGKSVQVRLYRNGSETSDAVYYAVPDTYSAFFARLSGTVLAEVGDTFTFDVYYSDTTGNGARIDANSTDYPNTVSWGLIC